MNQTGYGVFCFYQWHLTVSSHLFRHLLFVFKWPCNCFGMNIKCVKQWSIHDMSCCICTFCALSPSSAFGLQCFFPLLPSIMHSFLLPVVTSLFLKLRKQLGARKTIWEHNKDHCAPWSTYRLCYCSWYDKINNANCNVNLCFSWECL